MARIIRIQRIKELVKELADEIIADGGKPDHIVVGKDFDDLDLEKTEIAGFPVIFDDSLEKGKVYIMPKARDEDG